MIKMMMVKSNKQKNDLGDLMRDRRKLEFGTAGRDERETWECVEP